MGFVGIQIGDGEAGMWLIGQQIGGHRRCTGRCGVSWWTGWRWTGRYGDS